MACWLTWRTNQERQTKVKNEILQKEVECYILLILDLKKKLYEKTGEITIETPYQEAQGEGEDKA